MRWGLLVWLVVGLLLAGCGVGPRPQLTLASVAPGYARVVIYRTGNSPYDGLAWTRITLNGVAVGDSAPGTVFYRDVPPGTYKIEATSQRLYPYQAKTVALAAGSTTFVRVDLNPYWGQDGVLWRSTTFIVAIVDPAIGQYEIGPLKLITG